MLDGVEQSLSKLATAAEPLGGAFRGAADAASHVGSEFQEVGSDFQEVGSAASQVGSDFQEVGSALNSIPDTASGAANSVSDAGSQLSGAFEDLSVDAQGAGRALDSVNAPSGGGGGGGGDGGGGGGGGVQAATGGFISGPGTPTSDSILSWLSNGEFVVKARAVAHYGRDFFASLNNMRMPSFSVGGMVDGLRGSLAMPALALPAFAGGGDLVQSPGLHPVRIDLSGGRSVDGLLAPRKVVDDLHREAMLARVSSLGRKPKWVGS